MSDTLHVVTVVSNPLRWESRYALAKEAIGRWLSEPNVHVTLVEVAHGGRDHALDISAQHTWANAANFQHIPVRATTMAWSKENCLNIGISRLPAGARYIGTFDADIHFRKTGWAAETIHALQLYPVVQPWNTCYDLGPKDSHIQTHSSFCSLYSHGKPVGIVDSKLLKWGGGPDRKTSLTNQSCWRKNWICSAN